MNPHTPRILVIGAGSQGHAYAEPITRLGLGEIVGVCEPISWKRKDFGRKYIWGISSRSPLPHEEFEDWKDLIEYEKKRRERLGAGEIKEGDAEFKGVDAVFVCVLDELHIHIVKALAPLGLHVMCEKPLATSLHDCIDIQATLTKEWEILGKKTIFGIGHVLRYSPHNILLRKLVREDKVVGDVVSVEHTEPIGWWHMAHSFVRGNWRRQDMTAPSLLTKSCHDIDFLMWLLCSPGAKKGSMPHLPSLISSTGSLKQFRKARKPRGAGKITNCLSCPIESNCLYSSKGIYVDRLLNPDDLDWPLKSIVPEIEDLYTLQGKDIAKNRLLEVLAEDYTSDVPDSEVKQRSWYGRCVWECDNDVCDDQVVIITWEDDPLKSSDTLPQAGTTGDVGHLDERGAKTAIFHMIAPTEKICERRGRVYGTTGEITYDSDTISVHSFASGQTVRHPTSVAGKGHGGGDEAMAEKFCRAVQAVTSGEMTADVAQRYWLGCDIEEVVRSHLVVFAAEKARLERVVVDWKEFTDEVAVAE
ncbi:putative NAD binding Rossmann fold oxidoreductase [Mollisia scopiformis]|uniref:Putative NAD binding Rossmann fold oxidoreductase n=1 Tax=Mollisia scopiformis TaxID=149040 RepID=A0A194XWP2_MOLSC|nr:putative NAD binding Rossmann fold oxidoreductase [Mollisia scopiformis]KUJ24658.1 putative NAD binding Rossmann fold oxidoreductase [Mollisia scopiformis]